MLDEYEWATKDLGLAAAVMSLGARYVGADKADRRAIEFQFDTPPDQTGLELTFGKRRYNFEATEAEWINGTLRVNAVDFYTSLSRLKSVIHSR